MTAAIVAAALAAAAPTPATDEQRVGLWRQPAEAAVAHETGCPQIQIYLRAEAQLDEWYPPPDDEHPDRLQADGAAYDEHGAIPCTVWIRSGLDRYDLRETVTHEILHTAGYAHGKPMNAMLRRILEPTRTPNIRVGGDDRRSFVVGGPAVTSRSRHARKARPRR